MGGIHFAPLMFDGRVSEQRCERRDASGYGTQEGEHHKEYRECGGGPSGYPGSGDTPIFWVRMVILIFLGRCGACRGISGGGFGVSWFVRRRAGLAARAGGDGVARSLVLFQLAEAAVDGALDAAFVAGELDEGVGTFAIHVEGAGQEVALVGRRGRRRHRFAVLFGVLFLRSVLLLAEFFLCGDIVEAVAVDAGFKGEGAVQAPLGRWRCAGPVFLRRGRWGGSDPSDRGRGGGTLRSPRRAGCVCWRAGRGGGDCGWMRLCLRLFLGQFIFVRSGGWR